MNRGINRALSQYKYTYYEKVRNCDYTGICVFISHKSSDSKEAKEIAELFKENGIDVYIDLDDNGLQIASVSNNAQSVVDHIQEGLKCSTHLLAMISDDTKDSWWVPYEIGYAKKGKKNIASLILSKNKQNLPDYLLIEEQIRTLYELEKYVKNIKIKRQKYGGLFENVTVYGDELALGKIVRGY